MDFETSQVFGVKPILYSYWYFLESAPAHNLNKYDLWLAHYSSRRPKVKGWDTYAMQQVSGNNSFKYRNIQIDLNEFFGTKDELKDFLAVSKGNEMIEPQPVDIKWELSTADIELSKLFPKE